MNLNIPDIEFLILGTLYLLVLLSIRKEVINIE